MKRSWLWLMVLVNPPRWTILQPHFDYGPHARRHSKRVLRRSLRFGWRQVRRSGRAEIAA